jgi:hypothetical protein
MQQPIQPPQSAPPQETAPAHVVNTANKKKTEQHASLFMEHWLLLNQQEDEDNENNHILYETEG